MAILVHFQLQHKPIHHLMMPARISKNVSQESQLPVTKMKGMRANEACDVRRKRGWAPFMRKSTGLLFDSSVTSQETSSTSDTFFEVGSTSSSTSEPSSPAGLAFVNVSIACRSILKVKTQDLSISPANKISTKAQSKPVVKFSTISINNHLICLSDNPSVSIGPPLGISWLADSSFTLNLDEYEKTKPSSRDRQKMLVPLKVRKTMLIEAGHSRLELGSASRQGNTIRVSRRKSANDGHVKEGFSILIKKLKISTKVS